MYNKLLQPLWVLLSLFLVYFSCSSKSQDSEEQVSAITEASTADSIIESWDGNKDWSYSEWTIE